jgi:hypothetical protein
MANENGRPDGCLISLLRSLLGNGERHVQNEGTPAAGSSGPAWASQELPYGLRDSLLSPAELSFYRVAMTALSGRAVLCPKVRLADLFYVHRPDINVQFFNGIAQKHVDYVLCDPETLRPLAGVELDDSSHLRDDRQRRDIIVERIFSAAKLPLVRFPASVGYAVRDLDAAFLPYLNRSSQPSPQFVDVYSPAPPGPPFAEKPPICPNCGLPMVLRKAARGARRGEPFYGCVNYPRCHQVRRIDTVRGS